MTPHEIGKRPGKFARFGMKALMAAMLIAPALSLGIAEPMADIAFAKKNGGEVGTEDFTAPRYRQTITILDGGPASQYGSQINVKGVRGKIIDVNLILLGLRHNHPSDISIMLEHQAAGRSSILMRQSSNGTSIGPADIVLDNQASNPLPGAGAPLVGQTAYQPQDYDFGNPDFGGSPAPDSNDSTGLYLDFFNNATANGVWKLWVRDDVGNHLEGSMAGWQLEITTDDDLPYLAKDKFKTKQGRKLRVSANKGLLRSDPDNRGQDLYVELVQKPKKGKLRLKRNGSFKYKPKGNKKGRDTFTYRIVDTRNASILHEGLVVIKIKKRK